MRCFAMSRIIFEELDTPGEWYFDHRAKRLFYFPHATENLDTAPVAIARLESLLVVKGTNAQPVRHIDISGLVFTRTAMSFEKTTEPLLRSDWSIARTGAVLLEGTTDIRIRQSIFADLGGNALMVSGFNRRTEIKSNKISDIGASAVSVVGRPDAVRSPSFTYLEFVPADELDRQPGPRSDNYPADILIEDNLIFTIGRVEKQVAGIQIAMAARVTARANSIYDVPRAGINIGDGTWGGHLLAHNDVFATVLETGDHGAFNSWGRDRFWHPERKTMDALTASNPELIFLDAVEPVRLINNRFQSDHGWDIDLDDGSSNYIIENNLCLSGGLKLREGFRRIARNNILLNNSFHPHVWFENSHDVFQNNIVMTDYKPIWMRHWGKRIDRNFFPTRAALEKSQRLGLDANSSWGDPEFIDAEAGDFRVSDSSPARAIGFKNFAMTFGVISPWLKEQAGTPEVPELFLSRMVEHRSEAIEFMGAKVRSVRTLGDQSAFGLPELQGVIVVSVAENSPAFHAGLRARDVILSAFDDWNRAPEKITDVAALLSSSQARRWTGNLRFVVMRDQKTRKISIDLTQF